MGSISVLFFLEIDLKICQPHIILSLLASKTFLLLLTKLIVGSRPAIPTIEEIVISNLILEGISENLLYIFVLIFFLFLIILLYTDLSLIIKYLGLYFFICFLISK